MNNSVKCYKFRKLGHKAYECRSKLGGKSVHPLDQPILIVWRRKSNQLKEEENNLVVDGENHQDLYGQQRSNKWYVDSWCSKHMIGDERKFLELDSNKGGMITFGNNDLGKVVGREIVHLGREKLKAKNVQLVEIMKHELLSVSKMCDQGHVLNFDAHKCEVRRENIGNLVATIYRTPKDIYILDESNKEMYCMGQVDQSWL